MTAETTGGPFAHFGRAQADPHGGFAAALAEIRGGRKVGHWIWYVFPQLEGLGRSGIARRFALADLDVARGYLAMGELRSRLAEITGAVAEQLERGAELPTLMGSHLDALKVVSSLTLFEAAARTSSDGGGALARFAGTCTTVLDAAERQGYPRCAFTRERIARSGLG